MQRRIRLSLTLIVGIVLVLLTSSDSATRAAGASRQVLGTGLITLGPNQTLRITVAPAGSDPIPTETVVFDYGKIYYAQLSCSGSVCLHSISSQVDRPPMTIVPGQGASIDIPSTTGSSGVFAMLGVTTVPGNRKAQVIGLIIDNTTNKPINTFYLRNYNVP